jgi:hypothetical protein
MQGSCLGAGDGLRDYDFFEPFRLNPDFHALQWRNGVDFAPELLLRKRDAKRK